MEKHTRLNITLPQSIADELSLLSEEINDKKSRIIARALELYFDELDLTVAESRLNELEKGDVSFIPAEDVWTELGL